MTTHKSTFAEFHVLQNFVPSNLNRDDNGYPKSGLFGGTRRARISSQCAKWVIRHSLPFQETIETDIGERTAWLAFQLAQLLEPANFPAEEVNNVTIAVAKAYSGGMNKKRKDQTEVLLFLSTDEKKFMADYLRDNWSALVAEVKAASAADIEESEDGKKKGKGKGKKSKEDGSPLTDLIDKLSKTTQGRTTAPDIALYGRMLASRPIANLDAACQVANAFSTHTVEEMEVDYFTAVDDVKQQEGEVGAGMINSTGFNSACYYRYARIDWDLLQTNLDHKSDLSLKTVNGFLRGITEAVPTGMKNRFAQFNPPDFVLAVIRNGGPAWSLANAFEKSVRANEDGYLEPSVKALDGYWRDMKRAFGSDTIAAVSFFVLKSELGAQVTHLRQIPEGHAVWGEADSLEDWRKAVLAALSAERAMA